jgi:CubicO group peptidase (beta-lactamase class C family)
MVTHKRFSRSAAAALLAAVTAATEVAPSLEARLEWIAAKLEEVRVEHHAPGAAVAVVKDGEVVLLRGFGVADIETGREVTPDTRFAVGSTTKAFTATLVGMLADEGLMSFDEPARTHLPAFRINDPVADAQVTIRDLLCHRAGFAVMNALWYGTPNITRDEMIATMAKAELLHPFREKWNYSNESFLAAGLAAGNAAGSDWDALIAARIFAPLGMESSNTTYAAAQADPLMAKGYFWDNEKGELEHQSMRPVDPVGPAGSINSSARDMSRWVIFQLGRGEIEGERLLSEETHAQTWTHHIDVSLGSLSGGYGLGWFVGEWEGRTLIEHAGGIDGFTAEVAMLPDEGVGFVMLTNQFASPLQELSKKIVFRGLTGDISESEETAAAEEDFTRFTGNYTANFGPFQNATMKVLVQNGYLAVDVPGQMIFELHAPDADGKRTFRIADAIAVRFNESDRGEVYSFTIFQSGMTFEAIREGAQPPLEIDLAEAQEYLGIYHLEEQDLDLTVLIQNNRLAIDHPGQMVYELYPPATDGWCTLRVSDKIRVRFDRDAAGKVVSITQLQNGAETVLLRVGDVADAQRLPTVEQLWDWARDAGVIDAAGSLRSLRCSGTIRAPHMGLEGSDLAMYDAQGRLHTTMDLGGRLTETWIAGGQGLMRSFALGEVEMTARMMATARLQSPIAWAGDWRKSFDRVSVAGRRRFEEREVYALSAALGEGQATLLIDAETHLPLALETTTDSLAGAVPITIRLADWREVAGVKLPHRYELDIPMVGKMITEYSSIEANVPVEDTVFEVPAKGG